MPRARSQNDPQKKNVLTLAQIASYDDILTDSLVDHAFYWTTVPKNRPSYLPSRGVREEEITKIIQDHLIVEPDLQVAEKKFLATNGLGKFYRALKTESEKEHFRRHLYRYMQLYLPDCPFEVSTTNRYTIFQEEACLSARKFIKNGETIKYLSGIQVVITAEEEAALSQRKKDFSIIVSSRKKEVNLFMGPARFSNHDCNANARLVTTGQAGIEIIATRSIGVGEEITVTYGNGYFGQDNCECLCKTCEDNLTNGWTQEDDGIRVKQSVEDVVESHLPYMWDKDGLTSGSDILVEAKVPISGTEHALKQTLTPETCQESDVSETERKESTVLNLPENLPEDTKPGKETTALILDAEKSAVIDDLTLPTPESSLDSDEDDKLETTTSVVPSKETETDAETIVQQPRRGRPRKQAKNENDNVENKRMPAAPVKAKPEALATEKLSSGPPRRRVPGDYTLTTLLLSEPEMAWVICTVCTNAFVQRNAYVTRISCPRCERHSKLYGYMWPKTEAEGKWDKEERILDHRTVNRFLPMIDQTKLLGHGQEDDTTEAEDANRLGSTREATIPKHENWGSGIWRKSRYTIKRELAEQASKSIKVKREPATGAAAKSTIRRKAVKKSLSNTTKSGLTKTTTVTTLPSISKATAKPVASKQEAQPGVVKRGRGRPRRIRPPETQSQVATLASTSAFSEWDFV
ncbi:histone lysine methyltransferase Set9 [Sporothrix epigloea]|uniref:Histone-lysine N-methyltransferase SET9 n=1 Tax=Sporothrix epigloea TaxID=1892477 RepID=A0ABP0DSX8_9PEZI